MKPVATVIVIHGYTGTPDSARWHWLRQELESRSIAVNIPAMPKPNEPVETEWLDTITTQIKAATPPIILVGHSLGGLAVLRWLETRAEEPIQGAISLAGVTMPQRHTQRTYSKDWSPPKDWERIRRFGRYLNGVYSRNDTAVDTVEGEQFQTGIGTNILWVDGYGHFTTSDGVTQIPELLQTIETIIQLAK